MVTPKLEANGREGNQCHFENKGNRNCVFCFETICEENERSEGICPLSELLQFLKIYEGEAFSDNIGLCKGCANISGMASEQLKALQRIQMELSYNLGRIREMVKNTRNVKSFHGFEDMKKKENAGDSFSSDIWNENVTRMRERLSCECLKILSGMPQPRVTLDRINLAAISANLNSSGQVKVSEYEAATVQLPSDVFSLDPGTVIKVEPDDDGSSLSSLPGSMIGGDSDEEGQNENVPEAKVKIEPNENNEIRPISDDDLKIFSTGQPSILVPPRIRSKTMAKVEKKWQNRKEGNPKRTSTSICSGLFGDVVGRLKEQHQPTSSEDSGKEVSLAGFVLKEKPGPLKKWILPAKCHTCDKILFSTSGWLYHCTNIHPSKYGCDQCTLIFPNEELLQTHKMFDHSGTLQEEGAAVNKKRERFKCDTCDKTFQTKFNRRQHYETKHLLKRKNCLFPGCGKSYTSWRALKLHKEFKHPHWNPPQQVKVEAPSQLGEQSSSSTL